MNYSLLNKHHAINNLHQIHNNYDHQRIKTIHEQQHPHHFHHHEQPKHTLFNETGNIIFERITDKRRKLVADDTRRIETEVRARNQQSQRDFYEDENRKLREREAFRNGMYDRWKKKLADSPYSNDLWRDDLERVARVKTQNRTKRDQQYRQSLVDNMPGKYRDLFIDDSIMQKTYKHDVDTLLAFKIQKEIWNQKQVQEEQQILELLKYRELSEMQQKFPALSITIDSDSNFAGSPNTSAADNPVSVRSAFSPNLANSKSNNNIEKISTTLQSLSGSCTRQGSPTGKKILPHLRNSSSEKDFVRENVRRVNKEYILNNLLNKSKHAMKRNKKLNDHKKSSELESSSSTSRNTDSGIFQSPLNRMQQLADDISLEFQMLECDNNTGENHLNNS